MNNLKKLIIVAFFLPAPITRAASAPPANVVILLADDLATPTSAHKSNNLVN